MLKGSHVGISQLWRISVHEDCFYINKQCCQSTRLGVPTIQRDTILACLLSSSMRTGILATRSKWWFFQNTTKNRCSQSTCSPEENAIAFVRTLKLYICTPVTCNYSSRIIIILSRRKMTSEYCNCIPSTKLWYEPVHGISNNVVCATSKASDQPAHTRSLIRAFACRLNILWLLSYWLNTIWSFF